MRVEVPDMPNPKLEQAYGKTLKSEHTRYGYGLRPYSGAGAKKIV